MQEKQQGSTYAPKGKKQPVCQPGEFQVGVIGLDHGHIYGMCNGLVEAGAEIAYVYDPDIEKVKEFIKEFPQAKVCASRYEVLKGPSQMIATAAIPVDRCMIGVEAMENGKDFFGDKPSITTKEQLEQVRQTVAKTGKRFFIYFSERLHVEASVYAEELIAQGAIGKVVQVMGWGPHRLSVQTRPDWFFEEERYGGIMVDIGCHQIEQLMFFSGAEDAKIITSRIGNYAHTQYPRFQDFGDCMLQCSNGVTGYFRVDWFTPDGLRAWGDGRTMIVGTDGYIEIRKYIDVANSLEGDHVYLIDGKGEQHFCVSGYCGFPFFGKMIRDCMDGTQTAMTQEHIFRVMELAIQAQQNAMYVHHEE